MSEPSGGLEPIEPHLRAEEPPGDAVLVIRGGPLTAAKLAEHAGREAVRFSYRGLALASVSVEATVGGWSLEAILKELLWSRTTYATATAASLRAAGYELLPTFGAPHYDVVLAAATVEAAGSLLELFGPAEPNPYRRRR